MPASSCGRRAPAASEHRCRGTWTASPPLAFAPDARQMATGGFDGSVRLWEPAAPIFSPAACLAYPGETRRPGLRARQPIAPRGRHGRRRPLGCQGRLGLSPRTAKRKRRQWPRPPTATATPPADRPEKSCSLTRLSDQRIATFEGHAGTVRSVAFSADSRLIASGDQEGIVQLWDANGGRPLGAFPALELSGRLRAVLARRHGRSPSRPATSANPPRAT